jgi:MFS family permease
MSQHPPAEPIQPGLAFPVVLVALVGSNLFLGYCYNLPAVYASVVADDLRLPAERVGVYLSVLVFVCMLGSLFASQVLRRWGALRMVQTGTLLQAIGLGIGAAGTPAWIAVSAVVVGLGNGMVIPSVVHLLTHNAPRGRLSLAIAVTQSGTAFGAGLSGMVLPHLLETMPWRSSLFVSVGAGLAIASGLQFVRRQLDRERDPRAALAMHQLFRPWAYVLGTPALRAVGVSGFMLAFMSSVYAAFIVNYLHLELHYSLVAAGLVLTVSNISVIAGRLAAGWLTDRLRNPLLMLGGLTLSCGLLTIGTALLVYGAGTSGLVVIALAMTVGQSWFGVFLAAGARRAGPGNAAAATSGIQLFPISSTVIGPIVFGALVGMLGSYASAYLVFGIIGTLAALALLWLYRKDRA